MKIRKTESENINHEDISYLLNYCAAHTEEYNEIANHLWRRFGLQGAELCLLVTYYVCEERRKHE